MKELLKEKSKLAILFIVAVVAAISLGLTGCGFHKNHNDHQEHTDPYVNELNEAASYTDKDNVANYIHMYSHLPNNYITKKTAKNMGWNSEFNYVSDVAPGKSIGGDLFQNYSDKLPAKEGRKYYECDIDYKAGKRNSKRIVYSNDGMIFYTKDHYNTFEKIY